MKTEIKNEKFRQALSRMPQKTPPIWMMRQAGRYHQHYQALRAKHSFMELCQNPELAAQVALGPIQDFDFDVAILFSDLLFPLQALGMGLEYTDHGPRLGFQLDSNTIQKLKPWQDALPGLEFQKKALQLTREVLPTNKSLIGFVGGPWTLFGYAAEGSHKGNMTTAKKQIGLYSQFNQNLLPLLEANIQLQLDGGAEVVMIFDTAAGELSASIYRDLIAKDLLRLCQKFPGRLGYYSKGTMRNYFQPSFIEAPWAGLGWDHRWDLPEVFQMQKKGFVQGNFDQSLLHLSTEEFRNAFQAYVEPLLELNPEQRAGWVSGLGHGVLPLTPEKHVKLFVQWMREAFE